MKDLFFKAGKYSKNILMAGFLSLSVTACGHTIDPTLSRLPTYEMPTAVVVQTPPVRLPGQVGVGQIPLAAPPHYATTGQFSAAQAYMAMPSSGYQAQPSASMPQTLSRTDGATVIQQAPITLQRPSIVVPQQPIWVGNPPLPIPQPPVVINQPPVVYQQPSVIVRPPQIEFGMPVQAYPMMMAPAVTAVPVQPCPTIHCSAPSQPRIVAPSVVVPSRVEKEDYLPPK
ncbi:MAG: hypothetical protein HQL67_01920 [Magnetococcales bacterium]|nr:hypothetical protein [Magnetococcales bacterium]